MMAMKIDENNKFKRHDVRAMLDAAKGVNRIKSTHIRIHDGDLLDREMRERIACFDFETALEVRKLVV
jgi:hypothetical protein